MPKVERCIIGDFGTVVCYDARRTPKEYDRTFNEVINYICTNPDDYATLQEYHARKCEK